MPALARATQQQLGDASRVALKVDYNLQNNSTYRISCLDSQLLIS